MMENQVVKTNQQTTIANVINIERPSVSGGNLVFKLQCTKGLQNYFLSDHLEFKYDIDISKVATGILYIPAVASLISVAWAVGADISVQDIDETYLKSLADIKKVYVNWFQRFSFSTEIRSDRTSINCYDGNRDAVLYTGGLDSLTTVLRNKDRKPALISVWGASHPFAENNNVNKQREWEAYFHNQFVNESNIYCIYTNSGNLINEKLLVNRYIKEDLHSDDWWETVSHGITLTGLTAPITAVDSIVNLRIASSHFSKPNLPHGSSIFLLAEMKWASTRVIYDSGDLSRQDKIRHILKDNNQYYGYLHVCNNIRSNKHNCSHCEKCFRTIIGLIMEGIDPNDCNFSVHKGILAYIRICLEKGWVLFGYDQIDVWQDLQDHIDSTINIRMYDAGTFFTWFGDFNLSEYKYKGNGPGQLIQQLYYLARYDLAKAFQLAVKFSLSSFHAILRNR